MTGDDVTPESERGCVQLTSIVGARPQFVKLSAIVRAITRHNEAPQKTLIDHKVIHTGQHYDYEMSAVFFEELGLQAPDHHLGVGSGSHATQTGKMLIGLDRLLFSSRPDLVMVYGDTNSTLAGALAAAKLSIPVAHVEAGLRSFDRTQPEEINRVIADHTSDILFCPSELAAAQLQAEGLGDRTVLVGDPMNEVIEHYRREIDDEPLRRLGLKDGGYALATIHRAANTDNAGRLEALLQGLSDIAARGLPVVFPIHPRTRGAVERGGLEASGVRVVPPVSYREMLSLLSHARVLLTDSGGMQKEALWMQVPCVTLRDETEWPETVTAGWNTLAGSDRERIVEAALKAPPHDPPPEVYGRGDAGDLILTAILQSLSR